MESVSFKNLFDFFSYIEFCPLCKKRLTETITFPSSVAALTGTELIIIAGSFLDNPEQSLFDNDIFWKKITINLLDNSVSRSYNLCNNEENNTIIIGRQCNKYHFHYNGTANLSKTKLILDAIKLDKYHFIRIHKDIHFTINADLQQSTTSIRMTAQDFHTRELVIPFVEFDLSSKKKIDTKLKHIQLLG